jgi:hypothetical protein
MTMTSAAVLLGLVERATLAPSPHNVQPWRWTVGEESLEISVDPGRALPVSDPAGREAVMACGAALLTLRVAAAHARLGVDVEVLDGAAGPLARVRLADHAADVEFAALDAEVPVRRAWRGALRADPVPPALRARLAAEAHVEGARLVEVPATGRSAVARLVAAADTERGASARWRAEQARWVRAPWRRSGGRPVPAAALLPARLAVRYLDLGSHVGAQDAALVRSAPLLAVVGTTGDDPADWLAAGQALQRVLLVAAEHGLAAGFANSVCEDPLRRAALRDLLGSAVWPQAVLRLGRRPGGAPRARRDATLRALRRRMPVEDVVAGGPAPAQRKSTSPVSTS